MKEILLILLFLPVFLLAQVPQGVGYQGVATDANGIELVNQSISIRASVLSGSANGTLEWEETHATSTDTFGLFALTIGQGTSTGNGAQLSFADISWGTNTHFLKIEIDVTGGANYSFMGTNQMMSVPYALYAESANIDYDSISNLLSNDTTFITNVGGGIGGGGCDWKFPGGINGQGLAWDFSNGNNYTVPAGKQLYITNLWTPQSYQCEINGMPVTDGSFTHQVSNGNYHEAEMLMNPLILNAGDIFGHSLNAVGGFSFYGFLIDQNVDVTPITWEFPTPAPSGNLYTVPAGKNLYINNLFIHYGYSQYSLVIDAVDIARGAFNAFGGAESINGKNLNLPLLLNAGQTIDFPGWGSFNGYLVDENYFAGCGGSSNASANIGNMSVSAFGDTLTMNDQSVIVPGISFANASPSYGTLTDIDGNTYNTVIHGDLEIMAENLKVETFNNGDPIPEICYCGTNVNAMCSEPGWTFYGCQYGNLSYGRLYIGYTVEDPRNVCPIGWSIAGGDDWIQLLDLFVTDFHPGGNGYVNFDAILDMQSNESGLSILLGGAQGPGGIGWEFGQQQSESHWYHGGGSFSISNTATSLPQDGIDPNYPGNATYDYKYIRCVKD